VRGGGIDTTVEGGANNAGKVFEVAAKFDGRKVRLPYRLILVWSEAKARQEAATRERHQAKISAEFETIVRKLNKYSLKTEETIRRRLESARAKYDEGELFVYELTKDRRGQFSLTWKVDGKALERCKLLEGVYLLKTNLSKQSYPLAKTLTKYKEQSQVKRLEISMPVKS
jgi:hypothetical protein